jgi:two-component system LytT family response regulator
MSESNKIKAVVIDDSAQARKLLRLMLLELSPEVQVVSEAENAEDGLRIIEKYQPDAIFLDIEMPGKSGLQLAESLIGKNIKGKVVFTTAYNAYALKAFRLSAIDYILKPIQEEQLVEAVEKLKEDKKNRDNEVKLKALSENLQEDRKDVLCIPIQGGYEYLPLDEIEYLEADGSYVQVICIDKKNKTVSKNLKYFEHALQSSPKFLRTHRSFILNMDHVKSYLKSEGGVLQLKTGKLVPVSRERKQDVQNYFS